MKIKKTNQIHQKEFEYLEAGTFILKHKPLFRVIGNQKPI